MTPDRVDTRTDAVTPPRRDAGPRSVFGQPRALAFLAFTEAWERFSFYGMGAILVLYMSEALSTPGRIAGIAGFGAFRRGLETLLGPMSTLGLASQIYGLYAGLVYLTPVFGGWLADRYIGRRRAVVLGAGLMTLGHVAMAFDRSFLVALLLLIIGCGLLKGNISAQVGMLYRKDDSVGRTTGFAIFSTGINAGAIAGPLAIGLVAQRFGWHAGFALAGVLMLLGLLTYLAGYRLLPEDAARERSAPTPFSRDDYRIVSLLILIMAITVFPSVAFYQNGNIGLLWIRDHVDLAVLGFSIPVAWFNAIDPAASILFVPPLFALWRRRDRARGRRDELRLIAEGAWIACAANVVLVGASLLGTRSSALVPIAYDILLGISFLYYWPTLLALVSRVAPVRINATMVGSAFLSLFLSYSIIGAIGRLYESLSPAHFWALHAAIAATGGLLATGLRKTRFARRLLQPGQGS